MVRARSIHLAAACAALCAASFAAPDTGSGSGGSPADAEPLFGADGGDTLAAGAGADAIIGDPMAADPADLASPAAPAPEPAPPPAKTPSKSSAKAKAAAPKAEKLVAVVMQTSRVTDPATGLAIARHRVVSTPESRATKLIADEFARLADDEEIAAAKAGVGIVDLPAAD